MASLDTLRQRFLHFFEERGHAIVPPSSLLPDDPSVLFTTAGMQQFKPYYTGERDPSRDIHAAIGKPLGALRAVTIQPCVRTSDINDVGDPTHLTFFEMCGNFAFQGAYFKREAIEYAWRFLTDEIGLSDERLFVTVFQGDKIVPRDHESETIVKDMGVPADRVSFAGRDANFWGPTGKEGPCGPTMEIHYDQTRIACARASACTPNCSCGRYLELWNLVFNEYYADAHGKLAALSNKGVDTGMGFERLALVFFGVSDVFSIPFFTPAIGWIIKHASAFPSEAREATAGHRIAQALRVAEEQGGEKAVRSARIIADHLRASLFLAQAGILPSNADRGYVLRRLIRRAALNARFLELPPGWIGSVVDYLIAAYAEAYPKLLTSRESVVSALADEAARFEKGLTRGLRVFEQLLERRRIAQEALSGADLFQLFETHGFPVEVSLELASGRGMEVAVEGLAEARRRHQERSRAGAGRKFGGHGLILDTGELKAATEEEMGRVVRQHTATHLLQAALRQVLGPDILQRGSDITVERLRFDFSFPRKIAADELIRVEAIVNEKIRERLPVEREELPFQDAVASGALAFAKGAYPKTVSVYTVAGFSREVCGGPHVGNTKEIGEFRILKEEASAAGVRRIRATVRP